MDYIRFLNTPNTVPTPSLNSSDSGISTKKSQKSGDYKTDRKKGKRKAL